MLRQPSPSIVARSLRRQLAALRRPSGEFDAARYFRGDEKMVFFNVGTATVRRMAADLVRRHAEWDLKFAIAVASDLISDPVLEVKQLAVEIVARYRRHFTPSVLVVCKRWLAASHSNNWATTDALCGMVIGPLLQRYPALMPTVVSWSKHRNLWVRRASAVSLVGAARRGLWLDEAYEVAQRLHVDQHDLIHKAVGWLLREAGATDGQRLERYLEKFGREIPRTTVRYAIEKFPPARRRALLDSTRPARRSNRL